MAHAETTSSVSVLNAATKSLYLSATGHIKRHPVVVYEKTNQNREFEGKFYHSPFDDLIPASVIFSLIAALNCCFDSVTKFNGGHVPIVSISEKRIMLYVIR